MGRFNFGNQPNIGGNGGANNVNDAYDSGSAAVTEEYYGDEPTAQEEYNATLKDLWLCIAFCIVGWIVACVGFAMIANSDIGILLVLIGVIIVDLPCFKILLAGGSLGMLFGSIVGAERIIYYTDGTKKRDNSAWSAGLAVTIFTWLATAVVGVFAVVFRIFKDFMHLISLKKEGGIYTDAKTAPWLPIVVGIGVFVGGLIAVGIVGAVGDYQDSIRDDFSDAETVEIIEGIEADMLANDWAYMLWGSADGPYLTVKHEYFADEGRQLSIEITDEGSDKLGIDAGNYAIGWFEDEVLYARFVDGTTQAMITDEAIKLKLESFTIENILAADAMVDSIADVYAFNTGYSQGSIYSDGETETKITFKREGASGEQAVVYAGAKGDAWRVRVVEAPYSWEGGNYIEFKYPGMSGYPD